jgi:hypothetical protein
MVEPGALEELSAATGGVPAAASPLVAPVSELKERRSVTVNPGFPSDMPKI